MRKVVRLGKGQAGNIFCTIEYKDGRLSISGVEGPMSNGDAKGSAGQIVMSLRGKEATIDPAPGWDLDKLVRFFALWDEWHLNDMTAGSPAQEAWVKAHTSEFPGYPVSHYEWAREGLRAAGLHPDQSYIHNGKPYAYGSAWLSREVPLDVIEWLLALPDADTDLPRVWV